MTSKHRPVTGGSFTDPAPVRWDPGRDARGAAPDRGPRCTTRGCPFPPAGPGGPCREHAEAEAVPDPRARAMGAPARDRDWPNARRLTTAQLAELDGG